MAEKAKLPVGIENFAEMRTENFYYIDKTGLIRDLLQNPAKVNLFTRPRRFGKTLTMSMLQHFFETGCDTTLFDGLEIAKETELCDKYMGKFPVISISLKDIQGKDFDAAKWKLRSLIGREALRFPFLSQSDSLSEAERQSYHQMTTLDESGSFAMSDSLLEGSLFILSGLLQKYYGQNVIILIDEYDVPLDKAFQAGYYDDMIGLIRGLFGQALKTNNCLAFAVLTGCLRISKESIFTGMNNFSVYTVRDIQYKEYFGFTEEEVQKMLSYYHFMERYDIIKEWYDGYRFGNLEIYCPWDVMSYCHALKMNFSSRPQNYWINTSSNDIIRRFIDMADPVTKKEIEVLINGGSIKKEIHQELTYRDLDSTIDNLFSLLYTTGYLTQCGPCDEDTAELIIPNKEIRMIFIRQIQEWFKEETAKDSGRL
ncbi:MAG: AAA family ATPase, partial [Lachnospiraceae bacterium]|nr:AAA family ATPase [Lachnospiraceae bacterium]